MVPVLDRDVEVKERRPEVSAEAEKRNDMERRCGRKSASNNNNVQSNPLYVCSHQNDNVWD